MRMLQAGLRVDCWRDEGALERLAPTWAALHERSATATFFTHPRFARLWWHHFGRPGALHLWAVWEGEHLLGLAPLYEGPRADGATVRRLLGGTEVSDYLDIVAAPGREAAVVAALLHGWAEAPCHCPIELHALPHASPTREAFLRLAPGAGLAATEQREAVCPVLTLPATWADYLAQVDGKQRRELRRKLRKAGQAALVSWYRVPAPLVAEELPHFFALHAASSPAKAAFMTRPMRAFFTELALACAEAEQLDLCFLLVNGERAATTLSFRFRDSLLLYNSGYDAHDALSAGWLLLAYHIEAAIAEGWARYDFMQGDEAYKFRFGAKAEPLYQLTLTP